MKLLLVKTKFTDFIVSTDSISCLMPSRAYVREEDEAETALILESGNTFILPLPFSEAIQCNNIEELIDKNNMGMKLRDSEPDE